MMRQAPPLTCYSMNELFSRLNWVDTVSHPCGAWAECCSGGVQSVMLQPNIHLVILFVTWYESWLAPLRD